MSSIKSTPLVIFLILLIVLVISVIFGYRANAEGFTSYQFTKQPIDNVWIPQYTAQSSTSTVYKLYDNLFFDNKNGNLIEVDASGNGSAANSDNTGSTITNIYVTTRAGPSQTSRYQINLSGGNVIPQDTTESLIASTPNSYQSFKYASQSPNTENHTVFYMPWNDTTYVHIIDGPTGAKQIGTILFGPGNTIQKKFYTGADSSLNLSAYIKDTDPSNNKSNVDSSYNATSSVYQLSHTVKFDTQNANLIINTGAPGYIVYNRNGNAEAVGKTTATTIQNVAFNSFTVFDSVGQNIVLYASVGKKTLVALFGYKDATMKGYSLVNVKRFSETGLDVGSTVAVPTPSPTPVDASANKQPVSESDFYKMFWFMQTNGMPGIPGANRFSDDYLLKTQIVPPVCPTCPTCPACAAGNSTCANCGGKGGSGTLDASGSTIVQHDTRTNIAGAVSNLGEDVGDVANNVIKYVRAV